MEVARAERMQTPFSILMVDLDHLREINNAHGHLAGDVVIRGIAEVFREELRRYDVPARFGGDEFCILLPETPPGEAARIAERIRAAIADRVPSYDRTTACRSSSSQAPLSALALAWPCSCEVCTITMIAAAARMATPVAVALVG